MAIVSGDGGDSITLVLFDSLWANMTDTWQEYIVPPISVAGISLVHSDVLQSSCRVYLMADASAAPQPGFLALSLLLRLVASLVVSVRVSLLVSLLALL